MKKSKLFIENMLVFGFGQVISKIIPFFMLPIITRLMPDSSYMGFNDINVLAVSFGAQIAIMGLYDAMFRLYFEKQDKYFRLSICSTALANCTTWAFIIMFFIISFRHNLSVLLFDSKEMEMLIVITALNIFTDALNGIISAPTRIQNKRKVFLFTNTIAPLISYTISIPLLLNGNYLYALPLASLISSFSLLCVFTLLNRKFFNIKSINSSILKQLIKIGLPLMPTFLIYWIFSSFDRIMIIKLIGASAAGIYAVGNKVSMISQLVYQAFAGSWSYFSFSTMKDKNQVDTNSKIFNYMASISFAFYGFAILFSDIVFRMLFTSEYSESSIVFPYLFLSPLLLMLFQILGNQFVIIKKSYIVTVSLILGAITNISLNYILIPSIGIKGAAIATVIGYILSLLIALYISIRHKLYIIDKNFVLIFPVFIILVISSSLKISILKYFVAIFLIMEIMCLYNKEIKSILTVFLNKFKNTVK